MTFTFKNNSFLNPSSTIAFKIGIKVSQKISTTSAVRLHKLSLCWMHTHKKKKKHK